MAVLSGSRWVFLWKMQLGVLPTDVFSSNLMGLLVALGDVFSAFHFGFFFLVGLDFSTWCWFKMPSSSSLASSEAASNGTSLVLGFMEIGILWYFERAIEVVFELLLHAYILSDWLMIMDGSLQGTCGTNSDDIHTAEGEFPVDASQFSLLELPLAAMGGIDGPKTMKFRARIVDMDVIIMVDSGASHNFISHHLIDRIPHPLEHTTKFDMRLGDRRRTKSDGGVDLILGIAWLETLGDVKANWATLTMEFEFNPIVHDASDISQSQLSQLGDLLQQHQQLFGKPHGLPPFQQNDHQIVLHTGSSPVNVKPYHYGYNKKIEIERLVGDMLTAALEAVSHGATIYSAYRSSKSLPLIVTAHHHSSSTKLGGHFEVVYKPGRLNNAANALSRQNEDLEISALSLRYQYG
nr:peroxidase 64 [Ipomoea batatas]